MKFITQYPYGEYVLFDYNFAEFYDKDDNVVGISMILNDGVGGYDLQITGFESKADTSVFKAEKDGFKVQTAEEYLAS